MDDCDHTFALLISARASSAYFHQTLAVAESEWAWCFPHVPSQIWQVGQMQFLQVCFAKAPTSDEWRQMARLSFVQGLWQKQAEHWLPLDIQPDFRLHDDFVFGSKFKGKTNEHLTQLLINVALQSAKLPKNQTVKLLDPMCGRGTSLLWGLRYGMDAKGIEQDPKALSDVESISKKWCHIHRQHGQYNRGFVGGQTRKGKNKNKNKDGQFFQFHDGQHTLRIIQGDSSQCMTWLNGERFHVMVSDLPYGVQHHTSHGTRNPLAVIEASAQAWVDCLLPGGVLALAFNANLPKRSALSAVFESVSQVNLLSFSAPHRMSESIVRDVLLIQKQP